MPANTFDCRRAFMVSKRSFCFWPSWRWPGSSRLKRLRYCAPAEWGKLLGLDRAPEVRTLRVKVKTLAGQEQALPWSSELCKEWMAEAGRGSRSLWYRVNGVVRNMDAWYEAFDARPGDKLHLAPEDRVRIW
jgi:hypothetical protein